MPRNASIVFLCMEKMSVKMVMIMTRPRLGYAEAVWSLLGKKHTRELERI